jgi:hypothetical protein
MADIKADELPSGTIVIFIGLDADNEGTQETGSTFTPATNDFYQFDGSDTVGRQPASSSDVIAGTSVNNPITPDTLAAIWASGTTVAAASTVTLGDGNYFTISGNTGITAFAFTNDASGREAVLYFSGHPKITHNATTLILAGGVSFTVVAGTILTVRSDGSGNFRETSRSIVGSAFTSLTAGATVTVDGSVVQKDMTLDITANVDFDTISNLDPRVDYLIRINATGGPFSVSASGADENYNFNGGITIPTGKGCLLNLKYDGTNVIAIFSGYKD